MSDILTTPQQLVTPSGFQFSGASLDDLESSEYTIVTFSLLILILSYYGIYTCPLFEPHEGLKVGLAKKDSLKISIKNANKDPFLRLIAEKGTKGITLLRGHKNRLERGLGNPVASTRFHMVQMCIHLQSVFFSIRIKIKISKQFYQGEPHDN